MSPTTDATRSRRPTEPLGYVFDFGGVISVSPKARWESTLYPWCAERGVDRAAVSRGWKKYRHLWDGGFIPFDEMWRHVFEDAGSTLSAADVDYLWETDAVGWIDTLRPETLDLMKALKADGKKVGILTNMSGDFFERLYVPRCAEYRALVDAETVSGLVKMYKPNKDIYDLTASRMGLAPKDLMFYDDTESNIDAARSYGWSAELYPPPGEIPAGLTIRR